MAATTQAPGGELPGDPDAAIRQLYSHYARALHGYVGQFCPDQASADDIVQETFIRAWRHLPQLRAGDRPVRLSGESAVQSSRVCGGASWLVRPAVARTPAATRTPKAAVATSGMV
ncbi:MAG TPA: sigma factor [Streptosporangiaceae bacterium]|nr:sigma factor [Streptosporangiaceae bacterium]